MCCQHDLNILPRVARPSSLETSASQDFAIINVMTAAYMFNTVTPCLARKGNTFILGPYFSSKVDIMSMLSLSMLSFLNFNLFPNLIPHSIHIVSKEVIFIQLEHSSELALEHACNESVAGRTHGRAAGWGFADEGD